MVEPADSPRAGALRRRRGIGIGLVVAFLLVTAGIVTWRVRHATLSLEVVASAPALLEVDYKQRGRAAGTRWIALHPRVRGYRASVGDLARMRPLKVRVHAPEGTVLTVERLGARQPGRQPLKLTSMLDWSPFEPEQDLEFVNGDEGSRSLRVTGPKPRFAIPLPQIQRTPMTWRTWGSEVMKAAAITTLIALAAAAACGVLRSAPIRALPGRWSRWAVAALVILLLATVMALTSLHNAHPDEEWHLSAAGWYMTENLRPLPRDPLAAASYSSYGQSYLLSLDLAHVFLGKAMALASAIANAPIHLHTLARLLQCGLLAILAGFLLLRSARAILVIFLLTPQLWYLFSYGNSDAFGFFLALLLAYQVAAPQSALSQWLAGRRFAWGWPAAWCAAVAVAILFTKKNYALIPAFLGPVVAAQWIRSWRAQSSRRRELLVGAVSAILLAGGIFLALHAWEETRKPLSRDMASAAIAAVAKNDPRLWTQNLEKQGVSVARLLFEYDWSWYTLTSFVGRYGWMSIAHSDAYYWCVSAVYAALLAYVLFAAFWRSPPADALFTGVALGAMLATVYFAMQFSLRVDFQPQGRYLFPMLIAFGCILARAEARLNWRLLAIFLVPLFLAGVYSFAFTALRLINTVPLGKNL